MADALYHFSEEELPREKSIPSGMDAWKILIVDDEPSVHDLTRTVLKGFTFEGRAVEFLSAYSGKEARDVLVENPDTALILLDVVMETDDAGLILVRAIREELKNTAVRIILRTGQPGKAVERSVILEYDINDYKEKTELTYQKLFTSVVSSLRSYRDLQIIEGHRRKLELILRSSPMLFRPRSISTFATVILNQLAMILTMERPGFTITGYAVSISDETATVTVPSGESYTLTSWKQYSFPAQIQSRIEQSLEYGESSYEEGYLVAYFQSDNGTRNVVYLETPEKMSDFDHHLIDVFLGNVAVAFDNLCLSREIDDTQKEIIYTIGEMIERRSLETSFHVKRVSEVARLLAVKMGMDEADVRVLTMAAPMHDIGKVGIPDSILHKAGSLDDEEMTMMQTHTVTGYGILNKSGRPILKAAADIAYSHHEKWDGTGYPNGLSGEHISIFARIVAVADVFDSLLSRRSYKASWDRTQVRDFFMTERGRHFDPAITDILLNNLDEFMALRNVIEH